MFSPSRDQARAFFIDTWKKYRDKTPLTGLEKIASELILEHPEYQPLLEEADAAQRDFTPEDGRVNPFLHMSLHLAIDEQLSINQPPGLREAYDICLIRHHGDRHAALHDVLECLGETIWQAQRSGQALDAMAYVECVRKRGT